MSVTATRRVIISSFVILATSAGLITAASSAQASSMPSAVTSTGKLQVPRFGDSSPEVARLQQAIMARGFTLPGGVTGTFSPATRSALRSLQKVAGFKATGVVDERTAKFLGLVDTAPVARNTLPRVGQSGDAVWTVQQALVNNGVRLKGGPDGKFGLGTAQAIGTFQKTKGLPVTRSLDEATAIALGLIAAPKPIVSVAIRTNSSFPKFGDKGDVIRTIQTAMMRDSIGLPGGVDGHFGNATRAAIRGTKGIHLSGMSSRYPRRNGTHSRSPPRCTRLASSLAPFVLGAPRYAIAN
jgi:peptidoglycan hydrolase-like protein with peptidoglycan-binding domain